MSINHGGTTGALTMKEVINNRNVDANSKCAPLLAIRESRDAEFAMLLWMTHSTPLPSRKTTPTMMGVTASCSKIASTPPSFLLPHQSSQSLPFQVAVELAITLARTSVPSTLWSLTCQSRSRTSRARSTCSLVSSRTIPAIRVVLLLQEAQPVRTVAVKFPASTPTSPNSTRSWTTSQLMHQRSLSRESGPMVSASETTGGWESKGHTSSRSTLLSLPTTDSTQESTGHSDELMKQHLSFCYFRSRCQQRKPQI